MDWRIRDIIIKRHIFPLMTDKQQQSGSVDKKTLLLHLRAETRKFSGLRGQPAGIDTREDLFPLNLSEIKDRFRAYQDQLEMSVQRDGLNVETWRKRFLISRLRKENAHRYAKELIQRLPTKFKISDSWSNRYRAHRPLHQSQQMIHSDREEGEKEEEYNYSGAVKSDLLEPYVNMPIWIWREEKGEGGQWEPGFLASWIAHPTTPEEIKKPYGVVWDTDQEGEPVPWNRLYVTERPFLYETIEELEKRRASKRKQMLRIATQKSSKKLPRK